MSKVLVIEDEQSLRELYSKILSDQEYIVESAIDGEEGLTKVASFDPDVILLDIMLPKKTGFEVLQEIKNNEQTKQKKVIIMTNILPDKQDLYAKGADSVIIKTEVNPGQLIEKVATMLK